MVRKMRGLSNHNISIETVNTLPIWANETETFALAKGKKKRNKNELM